METFSLRRLLQDQLLLEAQKRQRELGWSNREVAQHFYTTAAPNNSQGTRIAGIMKGRSTILGEVGLHLLTTLGATEFSFTWHGRTDTSKVRKGRATPPAPLEADASLKQQLAWAANWRRYQLGWTYQNVAEQLSGLNGHPLTDNRVALFFTGRSLILSEVGVRILEALDLASITPLWDKTSTGTVSTDVPERIVPTHQLRWTLEQQGAIQAAAAADNVTVDEWLAGLVEDALLKKTKMVSPRPRISAEFSQQELSQLQIRAKEMGMTLERLVRNASLSSLEEARTKRYTSDQLRVIQAEASAQGHEWSLEELRDRRLPLFWNEAWTRARLAEGRTSPEIAVLAGGWNNRTVLNYIRNVYGIQLHKAHLSKAQQEAIRQRVEQGEHRSAVAEELGVSRFVVAQHTSGLADQRQRNFEAKAEAVSNWPATTAEIARALFGDDRNRAASWCRDMVRAQRLRRLQHGVYDLSSSVSTDN